MQTLILCLAASVAAFAQDGSGRSDSVARPAVTRKKVFAESRSAASPPPVRRIELGKLALTVNEGGSRVSIVRIDPPGPGDVIPVTSRSSSLIVRTLPAGRYRINVSKAGYSDEIRDVEVSDGRRQRVSIFLKPEMAFLTVAASVPEARLEIDNAGVYKTPANRILLRPGRYHLKVTRRGYVPQAFSVDLKTPGREENLRVVLKPQRIDDVLDDAAERVERGDAAAARELAGDVLSLNPMHARANLIFGLSEIRLGGKKGVEHLLLAVRNGEKVRIPVKIREMQRPQLLDAEIKVDRDGIAVKSPARFDLDFTIARDQITELRFKSDPAPGSLSLAGKSDFHGRPISPMLQVYPHDVVAPEPGDATPCAQADCGREFGEFAGFLAAWLSGEGVRK